MIKYFGFSSFFENIISPLVMVGMALSMDKRCLLLVAPLKKNEEVVEKLEERIVGRTSLDDVHDPLTQELLVGACPYIH